MSRYIFKYKGNSRMPQEDIQYIRNIPAIKILDGSNKLFLAEMDDAVANQLKHDLGNWSVLPQSFIRKPDTKKKVRFLHK